MDMQSVQSCAGHVRAASDARPLYNRAPSRLGCDSLTATVAGTGAGLDDVYERPGSTAAAFTGHHWPEALRRLSLR
jgi:hypothetical protein